MKTVDEIINNILDVETGKFTNDPHDSGGKTKWGWTEKSLHSAGWFGDVEDLTREEAFYLYYKVFVVGTGYAELLRINEKVAAELVDTAVNMGPATASKFLQVSLNAMNDGGGLYPDIAEDGVVGRGTCKALDLYLKYRGAEGETVLLRALNCLQGARYLELSRNRPKDERFVYGWISKRVII